MDYSKLSDAEINQSITCILNPDAGKMALIGDGSCFYDCGPDGSLFHEIPIPDYCNNAADAWPIILANKIGILWLESEKLWSANSPGDLEEGCWEWSCTPDYWFDDSNPLRAAMIVFLMMQGDE